MIRTVRYAVEVVTECSCRKTESISKIARPIYRGIIL